MDLELSSKIAVVTGGSRGIGKSIAMELAKEGTNLAIVARDEDRLKATAAEITEKTGAKVLPISADTGDDSSVKKMVQMAADHFGQLDILVNCAAQPGGATPPASLYSITGEDFWPDMNIKVMGYLRCAREIAPYMVSQGWGRIINISGLAARQAGSLVGSMRNISIVAMTKHLGEELGPLGINVTVVHPGVTRTERTPDSLNMQAERLGLSASDVEERISKDISIRRMVDAQEIAYVVAFLASPKSVSINGDVIAAGGGGGKSIFV